MQEIRKARRLLMKRRTAAEALDVSITTLKKMEIRGDLTPIRIGGGGRVHYHAAEIERLATGKVTRKD